LEIKEKEMNTMDDIQLLETIEKYLAGEMTTAEAAQFESMRKTTPEIDQMVIEHSMFLGEMENYTSRKNFSKLSEITFNTLFDAGEWTPVNEQTTAYKLIQLWHRYKKVTAIAATVGGLIAMITVVMTMYFSPSLNGSQVLQLSKAIEIIKNNQLAQGNLINEVKTKLPENAVLISGGTGFLIDTKGYMITNAHVLKGNKAMVISSEGNELNADIIYTDQAADLALLKINDADFMSPPAIPYSIRKKTSELGEEVYTLGYPRNDNDIVYGKGYLSATTGFEGDSNAYQLQISANPGYSGAPVFNENAELIGIINTRQMQLEGVTFAIRSNKIFDLIAASEKTEAHVKNIKLQQNKSSTSRDRKKQISNLKNYIYNIRSFN
jgi:S1-C subfamily serine protease